MIFDHAKQGTPEWHQARCGVLTASLFSTAIDTMQSSRDGRQKGAPSYALRWAVMKYDESKNKAPTQEGQPA